MKKELSSQDLKLIQQESLKILIEFDKFAKEHDIKYFLDAGTLLGAVRHDGYIPWDDDLDISMLREDFIKLASTWEHERYKLNINYEDNARSDRIPKIIDTQSYAEPINLASGYLRHKYKDKAKGVYLDIFILDNKPQSKKYMRKHKKYQLITDMSRYSSMSTGINFMPLSLDKQLLKRKVRLYNEVSDTLVRPSYLPVYGENDLEFKREDIFPLRKIKFEGYEFYAPNDSDAYLTKMFGDYMQLPKIEDQKPKHYQSFKYLK